jgi:hypothetical protein
VVGGVISSTLLTLVLVPTMYTYLDSLESFVRRNILRQKPRFVETPMPPDAVPGSVGHAELGYDAGGAK